MSEQTLGEEELVTLALEWERRVEDLAEEEPHTCGAAAGAPHRFDPQAWCPSCPVCGTCDACGAVWSASRHYLRWNTSVPFVESAFEDRQADKKGEGG